MPGVRYLPAIIKKAFSLHFVLGFLNSRYKHKQKLLNYLSPLLPEAYTLRRFFQNSKMKNNKKLFNHIYNHNIKLTNKSLLTYPTFLVVILLFVLQSHNLSAKGPRLVFDGSELVFSEEEKIVDLGEVKQGAVCGVSIVVKNQSQEILRIANVRGSCALSVPSWPRRDIEPGGEGVIQIRYDSSRPGPFNRNVTIHANTQSSVTVLRVQGKIIP